MECAALRSEKAREGVFTTTFRRCVGLESSRWPQADPRLSNAIWRLPSIMFHKIPRHSRSSVRAT
jgi:hypothetical protein